MMALPTGVSPLTATINQENVTKTHIEAILAGIIHSLVFCLLRRL